MEGNRKGRGRGVVIAWGGGGRTDGRRRRQNRAAQKVKPAGRDAGPTRAQPPPTSLPMKLPTFFSLSLSLSRSSPSPLSLLLALAFCLFISFGGFREKVWMDLPRADAPLPLPFGDGREFFRPPAFRARLPFPPSPSSSSPRCFSFRLPWPGLAVGMEIGIDELDGRSARTAGRCTKMVYVDVGLSAGRIRPCHYCHRQALVQRKGARLRAPECFSLGAVYLCHFCFFFLYLFLYSGSKW